VYLIGAAWVSVTGLEVRTRVAVVAPADRAVGHRVERHDRVPTGVVVGRRVGACVVMGRRVDARIHRLA